MYKFKNKLSFELCYKEIKHVWKFSKSHLQQKFVIKKFQKHD